MNKPTNDHIENLRNIRKLMESSTRFKQLSGRTCICTGIIAIAGIAVFVYFQGILEVHALFRDIINENISSDIFRNRTLWILALDFLAILILSIAATYYFVAQNSKTEQLPIWSSGAKNFLSLFLPPLIVGASVLIILMIKYHILFLFSGLSLLFYGLALYSAGRASHNEITYMGISNIILGLLACWFVGYSILFWVLGFGVVHIVFGLIMYFKYERR